MNLQVTADDNGSPEVNVALACEACCNLQVTSTLQPDTQALLRTVRDNQPPTQTPMQP